MTKLMSVKRILLVVALTAMITKSGAQDKVVALKYGNMDSWVTRTIHESGIIGRVAGQHSVD